MAKRVLVTCGWCKRAFPVPQVEVVSRQAKTLSGLLFCSPSCTSRHHGNERRDPPTTAVCGYCARAFPIGERTLATRLKRSKCGLVFCSVTCGGKSSLKTEGSRAAISASRAAREGPRPKKRYISRSDDCRCAWCSEPGLYTDGNERGACEDHRAMLARAMEPWGMAWADGLAGWIHAIESKEPVILVGDLEGLIEVREREEA